MKSETGACDVEHIPVLARTLNEQINLPLDGVMVDATIGQGGHSFLFGKKLSPKGFIVGFDVDKKSILSARTRVQELKCEVILIHSNFSRIKEELEAKGIEKVDFILADLGLCSAQLTDSDMGLSFQTNMPLDMRFDKRLTMTAADIVNQETEEKLANLIYEYGEDRASRRIARFIVQHRRQESITTTSQLAAIVTKALGYKGKGRKRRIHPATRTFQALRIAVNNELDNLESLLATVPDLLKKDGRIAIISFHSLEDRLVKNNFRLNAKNEIYRILTKKPVVPSKNEITENPRARSAKLRIAAKQ